MKQFSSKLSSQVEREKNNQITPASRTRQYLTAPLTKWRTCRQNVSCKDESFPIWIVFEGFLAPRQKQVLTDLTMDISRTWTDVVTFGKVMFFRVNFLIFHMKPATVFFLFKINISFDLTVSFFVAQQRPGNYI